MAVVVQLVDSVLIGCVASLSTDEPGGMDRNAQK